MSLLRNINEQLKLFLYNSRTIALQSLRIVSIVSSIVGVGLMIYYHGFPHTSSEKENLLFLLKGLFVYYVLSYFVRLVYALKVKEFLKQNWLESLLLLVIVVDAALFLITGQHVIKTWLISIGFGTEINLYELLLQLYLLILIALEVGKVDVSFSGKKVNPAVIFIFIFGGIIFLGTALLMMPEMTRPILVDGKMVSTSMNFIDALFTSTSAACVTGLMVEDTMSFFTLKGQLVILLLIKVGGLNIVAFGLFFAVFSRFGLRVEQHDIIEDIVNKVTFSSARGFFSKILFISLGIEFIGALLLFMLLPESPEVQTISQRIHFSIFHSVSAFNNAGISLYEGGFANPAVAECYPVLSVMSLIIFIGTLGFITILDLISIRALTERIHKPWKKLQLGTKVGLLSNTHLLILGALFFIVLEWDAASLEGKNIVESIITSVFQVVNRTAGFNSVDLSLIGLPMVIVTIMLMFIGGSSSSTAGGVKTSTMTLLFVSIFTTIRGKKNAELFHRNISKDLLLKAYAVIVFAVANIFLWTFLLSITEADALANGKMTIMELVYEEVSAFSTVGLSLGVTAEFSSLGKIILSISMFIGRLGTLMLLMALSKRVMTTNYKYPDAHIMIG